MSEAALPSTRVVRIKELLVGDFVSAYLEKNEPVIVTGAMQGWRALTTWNPNNFAKELGTERVQIYGDLFKLSAIDSLNIVLVRSGSAGDAPPKGGRQSAGTSCRCAVLGHD